MIGLLQMLWRSKPPAGERAPVEFWQAGPDLPPEARRHLTVRTGPDLTVDEMIDLIERPEVPHWHPDWHRWENTRLAHLELMRRTVASTPPFPPPEAPRGIVICSGGWRFFASTYVTVRVIRHVGCTLPIECWYLGDRQEYEPDMGAILGRQYGVTWIDGNARAREAGIAWRTNAAHAGWQLKALALYLCRFREALLLDSDCFPLRDPVPALFEHPKYLASGAVFFPDIGFHSLRKEQFHRFGLPWVPEPPFESGQSLVDRQRCWKAVRLAWWINNHSDYAYEQRPGDGRLYGDKDTFQMAWRFTRTPFVMHRPGVVRMGVYLHRGLDDKKLFAHRVMDKFVCPGPDNKPVRRHFTTGQRSGLVNARLPRMPLEDQAHAFRDECEELVTQAKRLRFRTTADRQAWDRVCRDNCYRLPDFLDPKKPVIDLTAGIGAFAWLALRRGARCVYAVERDPELMVLLRNLEKWRDHLHWRTSVVLPDFLTEVAAAHGPIQLVKADNTLLPPALLRHVETVCGKLGWPACALDALQAAGFEVSTADDLYWAKRPAKGV